MARSARRAGKAGREPAILLFAGLLFALSLYSITSTAAYLSLSNLISSPTIMNPPILFFVGSPAVNVSGKTAVPLSQNFCPESAAIMKQAAANPNYIYYTYANAGQSFSYSLVYNASKYTFAYAVVIPPFKLASYTNAIMNQSNCLGWPNALGNATLRIQAPTSPYAGPFYGILYFSKK